jgi:hypothetical protein
VLNTACNPSFTKQVQKKDGHRLITDNINLLAIVNNWFDFEAAQIGR